MGLVVRDQLLCRVEKSRVRKGHHRSVRLGSFDVVVCYIIYYSLRITHECIECIRTPGAAHACVHTLRPGRD